MGLMSNSTDNNNNSRRPADNNMNEKYYQLMDFIEVNNEICEASREEQYVRRVLDRNNGSVPKAYQFLKLNDGKPSTSPLHQSSSSQPQPRKKRTFSPNSASFTIGGNSNGARSQPQYGNKRGKPKSYAEAVSSSQSRVISLFEDDDTGDSDDFQVKQASPVNVKQRAVEQVTKVVKDKNSGNNGGWRIGLVKMLNVSVSNAILKQVDDTMQTIIAMERGEGHEVSTAITRFVDILTQLPHAAHGDTLAVSRHPADHDLNMADKDAQIAVEECDETAANRANGMSSQSKADIIAAHKNYALAPQKAVHVLTKACEANIARFHWYTNAKAQLQAQHQDTLKKLEISCCQLQELKSQVTDDLACADRELMTRKDSRNHLHVQFQALITDRVQQCKMVETDQEEENQLRLDIQLELLQSTDPATKSLIQKWQQSKKSIVKQAKKVQDFQEVGIFLESCIKLSALVTEVRKISLAAAVVAFEEETAVIANLVETRLERYVPGLCTAILRFNEFHSRRKRKADASIQKYTEELADHMELFFDEADLNQESIRKKLEEVRNCSMKSNIELREMAASQITTWKKMLTKATANSNKFVMKEFTKLWEKVDGPFRQSLTSFLGATEPAAAAAAVVETPFNNVVVDNSSMDTMDTTGSMEMEAPHAKPAVNAQFPLGARINTVFVVGGKYNKFIKGTITGYHDDGTYTVKYDDNETHHFVDRMYLLSDAEAEHELEATRKDNEENDDRDSSGNGGCSVM